MSILCHINFFHGQLPYNAIYGQIKKLYMSKSEKILISWKVTLLISCWQGGQVLLVLITNLVQENNPLAVVISAVR